MKSKDTDEQEIRTKKLFRVYSFSVIWMPIFFSIAFVLIFAGAINLIIARSYSFLAIGLLLVGICMVMGFCIWRKRVTGFMESEE